MGYQLNSQAYLLFVQIEVGLREYFIELIKRYGVTKWTQNFLGSVQRDTLAEVNQRISNAYNDNRRPLLEDIYILKLYRAKKDKESSFITSSFCHPFYYLNWSDLESLMRIKTNIRIIDDSIGKVSRTTIVEILKMLSFLRNDIAHSRFISDNDFLIIQGGYKQILGLIPDFTKYIENQSKEDNIADMALLMIKICDQVQTTSLLSLNDLDETFKVIDNYKKSFWLNSLCGDLVNLIENLEVKLNLYREYRKIPGGLLSIMKWKKENSELINKIKNTIKNGKF